MDNSFSSREAALEFIQSLRLPVGEGPGNFPKWEMCRIVEKVNLEKLALHSRHSWGYYDILESLFWHRKNVWVKEGRRTHNVVEPLPPEMGY